MAVDVSPSRSRRIARALPLAALVALGGIWLTSLRYTVKLGGDHNGGVGVSIAHVDAWPGTFAFHVASTSAGAT